MASNYLPKVEFSFEQESRPYRVAPKHGRFGQMMYIDCRCSNISVCVAFLEYRWRILLNAYKISRKILFHRIQSFGRIIHLADLNWLGHVLHVSTNRLLCCTQLAGWTVVGGQFMTLRIMYENPKQWYLQLMCQVSVHNIAPRAGW